jgi:Fe-S cluster assembly iron-binding protein IscA
MIAEELNLPPVKIHCSVLAEDAIKSAIADFRKKQAETKLMGHGFKFVNPNEAAGCGCGSSFGV